MARYLIAAALVAAVTTQATVGRPRYARPHPPRRTRASRDPVAHTHTWQNCRLRCRFVQTPSQQGGGSRVGGRRLRHACHSLPTSSAPAAYPTPRCPLQDARRRARSRRSGILQLKAKRATLAMPPSSPPSRSLSGGERSRVPSLAGPQGRTHCHVRLQPTWTRLET